MKIVEFTNITVEDFCAHRGVKSFDLGKRVFVKGKNGVGKSTLKKAIQYVLNIKDESGKEISGIRPHDENGADIDGLTTAAQLTVSVDGAENTLKKTYRQKKNRAGEYTGESDTQYFIDDVRKSTKKSYDDFIQSFLPDSICINAQEFLRKDTAGRRKLLADTFGKHGIEDIVAENPEFKCLLGKLRANSPEDLKKAYRVKIKELNDKLTKIQHQIEFEQSNKKDIDLAELELQRNALLEQIAAIEEKEMDACKQSEDYQKLSEGVLALNFKLSDLEREANRENIQKRKTIEDEISEKTFRASQMETTIKTKENDISYATDKIKTLLVGREEVRKLQNAAWEREFNEDELACPYCGQEMTESKKEQLRVEFESNKRDELERIAKEGIAKKAEIEKEQETIWGLEDGLDKDRENLGMLNESIAELNQQLSELPERIDISEREDVKEIKRQIAEKEAAMKQCDDAVKIKNNLTKEKSELQKELIEVETQFKVAEKDMEADDRIAGFKKQQRETAQQVADIEREDDLLSQFLTKQAEILEQDVNSQFDLVQFKMHEKQINGGMKEVCQILVNGEGFDRNLNFSNKILAEVEICRAFQRAHGIQCGILIDNAESIDPSRIPDVPNQLLIFMRSDDEELKVEVV